MKENQYFPNLFKAGYIGKLRIKNRLVMLPMARVFAGFNGEVTQKTVDYYAERAKGGVGLIIVGATNTVPMDSWIPHGIWLLNLCGPEFIPGHHDLVEAVHAQGAKIGIQLSPGSGGQTRIASMGGKQPISASGVQQYFCDGSAYDNPRPITKVEIYGLVEMLAQGAGRAKTCGYDLVDYHFAHDYLVGGFMSPKVNRRTDEFGGSLENRMRFAVEIVKRTRGVVGSDYPISVRIDASDFIEGGITTDESPKMAKMLEEAGASAINVSSGAHETLHLSNDIARLEEGWKIPCWSAIKKAVSVPTIAGGGNRTPEKCEKIIVENHGDFVGLGRTLIADPEWPKKAMEGSVEDIRKCYMCGQCLYAFGGVMILPQACAVNAAWGRERYFSELKPPSAKKKVMIIGGGVAGMEAARMASLRGHKVALYEKEKELAFPITVSFTLFITTFFNPGTLDKSGICISLIHFSYSATDIPGTISTPTIALTIFLPPRRI